ncbi:penicillin-binding protein 2 [Lachnospiraceae bacterium OM04-12BH]|nr:penicillin-binding protein 2 [Lachnospiraceae bacterium OM04-12BH]
MGRGKSYRKFTIKMQKKLVVLFIAVLLAFAGLFYQLYRISRDNGEQYKKQVLSQQRYDSTTIPYKRGTILDANGSVLATSEKVYNVILDSVAISEKEEYLEPTLSALQREFGIDTASIRDYIEKNKETSRYHVLAKRLSYSEISDFLDMQNEEGSQIKGIWFDEEYKRVYPGNSLACDVIGFTTADNRGNYGLEEYYNDVLSGIPGREYGYLNDDSDLERKTIAAEDGNSLVTTIDANIQSIVEKYLLKFNEEYKDKFHPGNGAENVGCIIMKVDSGEILAMANYPNFDLNDTRNTDALMGMPLLDEKGNKTGEYLTEENMDVLDDEEMLYQHLDALWKNYCISSTYEPGSVAKPFTVAAGVESGKITGTETYNCEGSLEIGGWPIRCHNRYGDGLLTVQEGIERSCNVVMMKVGQAMGTDTFVKFQHIFNFGLKTNIDLQGEARTASLVYTKDTMGSTEMATNTFGQSFNVTMIQMITGFCSLINGGYYYEPHMVSKIVSPSGATVQNIEPRVLKQTISEDTSDMIREYCNTVVTGEHGTGKTARPAGYMIGGKTGTAETLPRKNGQYVVSFMGYAPADDPQIAIYVVVDRPNVQYQDDAKFATRIVRGILTEVLPYMGIFMTEELSDSEREELEALQIEIRTAPAAEEEAEEGGDTTEEGTGEENGEDTGTEGEEETEKEEVWKSFPIDPSTGYAVDPNTGDMVDPVTGAVIGGSYDENAEEPDVSPSPEASADPEGDTGDTRQ